jgi:hypothetical protein
MSEQDHDTPTQRATINQFSVDQLDIMLSELRERRLARVKQLEAVAKIKSDEAQLVSFMKFERAYKIALRYLKKCEAMETRAETLVHKTRVAAMVVRLEVGEDENDGDEST